MKTIVNIMSKETIPNYLFIKEMYKTGDKIMFISSKQMEGRINFIKDTLKLDGNIFIDIVFKNEGDEEKWDVMQQCIRESLSIENKYFVNLTGGTKYMSLAVQNIFSNYNSQFFYIPYPKNQIISISQSKIFDISYRVKVNEYINLCGLNIRSTSKILHEQSYTDDFKSQFLNSWTKPQFTIVDLLRSYRDYRNNHIRQIEHENSANKPQIENLTDFLSSIHYPYNDDILTKADIQYITGGWFEEYVYSYVKTHLSPNDILLSTIIQQTGNELDVTFTLGNKLYVIECKTGVDRRMMLNEIVYKASALKSSLFALSAKSYIFALSGNNPDWELAAKNMNITYCGREFFQNPPQLNNLLDEINKQSFN